MPISFLSESITLDGGKREVERSSIIILPTETIGKNVRRKSGHRHRLLPHTYAPRESHKSRGALKLCNLLNKGWESVGCSSSRMIMRNCTGTRSYPAGRRVWRPPLLHVYVCRSARIQNSNRIRIASDRSTPLVSRVVEISRAGGWTFPTRFFG